MALMEQELWSLARVSLLVSASMAYARFASARIPPGKLRLLALSPVLCLLPFLPWSFSTFHLRGFFAASLAWLCPFKLLLLAFGCGPLSPRLTLLHFIAAAALPITLRSAKPAAGNPTLLPSDRQHRHLRFLPSALKVLLLAALMALVPIVEGGTRFVYLIIFCLGMYLYLDLIFSSVSFAAASVLGLELGPSFNAPLLSASLQELWGQRWSLAVSALLRESVYDPVRRRWGATAGLFGAFLVSGVMHEVMFYYWTEARPTGETTAFFLLHGLCTAAEVLARRAGWQRPAPAVAVPLTVAFAAVTTAGILYPPFVRAGVDEWARAEVLAVIRFTDQTARALLGLFGLA